MIGRMHSLPWVLAVTLCAGCKVGPDYRRPEVPVPQTFRFESTAAAESVADLRWWEVYQDPSLQSLIREALANNLDLRTAAARVDEVRAALGATRLQQLPQISIDASGQRARSSSFLTQPGVPQQLDVFSLTGGLSYEVDFWGKFRRASEAARANLMASEFARQDVIAGLVASVATAYFTLQNAGEQLAITHRTLDSRQKFLDLTRARHDRGAVSGLDVATAEAQLAVAQAVIPDLERQIAQTEDQLSVLLGHNPAPIVQGPETELRKIAKSRLSPVPPAGIPSDLLRRRADLREAEQNLIAANAQVGVAKANLFPSIALTGTGGGTSTVLSDLLTGPAVVWSVGVSLVQPLLDSQRSLYQVEMADAQKRQALLQYEKNVQVAFQEVSDALIARQKLAQLQEAQERQVAAEQRANDIALARYRIGYSSYFDVITADSNLYSAQLALSAAHLNTLLALVQLYRALGGGW